MSVSEDTRLLAAERVVAGAEFMDLIDPEWFWVVNPDTMNMGIGNPQLHARSRECGCVLAQHHPDGTYRPTDYGLIDYWGYGIYLQDIDTRSLGFADDYMKAITYSLLTELWREAINDRRADWLERHPRYLEPA